MAGAEVPALNQLIDTAARFVQRNTALPTAALHYGGFVLAGALAFVTDASLLLALTAGCGLSPLLARPIGIGLAMIVSWLVNRTVTFAVVSRPSYREFAKYAAVVGMAQAVNYVIFAVIVLTWPTWPPIVALILACLVSMLISYMGYRYGVFGRHWRG